jgi:hypothetical protein
MKFNVGDAALSSLLLAMWTGKRSVSQDSPALHGKFDYNANIMFWYRDIIGGEVQHFFFFYER